MKALHRSTFEITTESHLTARGDCIIGVGADKSARTLAPSFRSLASRDDARVVIALRSARLKGVLVDTYALLAAATGGLTPAARSVFSEIRKGREKGLIHALIVYEALYH